MNLLNVLLQENQGQGVEALSRQFGLDTNQTQNVLGQLLPVLVSGLQRNTSQQGGLESLLGALSQGNHSRYLEDPSMLGTEENVADGNGILGHILGSKDVSREVARQVGANTGLSDSLIRQMLPVVASLAMGALAKQTGGGQRQEGLLGMLDMDGDGSMIDDVAGLLGKFFGR